MYIYIYTYIYVYTLYIYIYIERARERERERESEISLSVYAFAKVRDAKVRDRSFINNSICTRSTNRLPETTNNIHIIWSVFVLKQLMLIKNCTVRSSSNKTVRFGSARPVRFGFFFLPVSYTLSPLQDSRLCGPSPWKISAATNGKKGS